MKLRLMHAAIGEIAFPLKPGGSLVIGRLGPMTDVEISWDPRISRRHCRVWEKDGRIWFQDLASRNGSWIGSDRVTGVKRLAPGASVIIGETVLLVPDARAEGSDEDVEETHERPATPEEIALLEEALEAPESKPTAALRSDDDPLRLGRVGSAGQRPPTLPPRRAPSAETEAPPIEAPFAATVMESTTVDLRSPSEVSAPAAASPPPAEVSGAVPRFESIGSIVVEAQSREELHELWKRDLSKGGLFVETRRPPDTGRGVEVRIETPGGTLSLRGTVVHVITPEMASGFGGRPGVGIQFLDMEGRAREAIQAYVEGVSSRLEGESQDLDVLPEKEGDQILELARRFLHDAEKTDFYKALEIPPASGRSQIEAAATRLHRRLSEGVERLPPPRAARIEAALNVLGRVRRVLANEEGRLEYDFRKGHVRAEERMRAAAAGTGPSLSTLKQAWNRVFPDRVDKAALLTRKAFTAKQRQDLESAIDAGRAALALNPFFEELRHTVDVWEMNREQ